MFRLGLPVPPGFVITTETCTDFFNQQGKTQTQLSTVLVDQYTKAIHELEKQTGKYFGGVQVGKQGIISTLEQINTIPLLLSVRSGAAVSMPGMMDTILNLGINEELVLIMARLSNNPRWAFDTYRRFLSMFGTVVLGAEKSKYEEVMEKARKRRGVEYDSMLTMSDLQTVVKHFKEIATVPDDPWEQLQMAIEAVFCSWYSPRAVKYRDIHGISNDLGTAVTVQSMVYGNMNMRSGSGVAFTRNPATGEKVFYGEYLNNAEGEDVVAGIRTPMTVQDLQLEQPTVYDQLSHIERLLERHYRDMQDIEFTVENGVLFILQTRRGKRTALAAVRIAVSMVQEKLITERDALMRIDPYQMDFFLHPMIDPVCDPETLSDRFIGEGLAASAGAACGVLAFTCEDAEEFRKNKVNCILCRNETSADDIAGLNAAIGVLTIHGGVTSHAAVVMRGMGKPAVTGANRMSVRVVASSTGEKDESAQVAAADKTATVGAAGKSEQGAPSPTGFVMELVGMRSNGNTAILRKGDVVTIDGSSGKVYFGEVPTVIAGRDANYQTVLKWADKYKRMQVLVNAETFDDVQRGLIMGAEGVGLVRTEHMFFEKTRLDLFRQMILSATTEDRCACLMKMLPMQQQDFTNIFRMMSNRQVTVRLLDPPLHEFLPKRNQTTLESFTYEEELLELSARLGISLDECVSRISALTESNPMLGFRGCRLSVVYPEITEMQTRAIFGAALDCMKEGITVSPQIMIPLVCSDHEVSYIVPIIRNAYALVCEQYSSVYGDQGYHLNYSIGCMLEVPRAFLRAERIAAEKHIDFVSIGTNDLTQMVFGFSRDDTQRFMPAYLENHILAKDPFISLDIRGVGSLVTLAINKCKKANPAIKVGICGEHAGDPASIQFFNKIGLDYVSCSPSRIPIAKMAAAQAHIEDITRFPAKINTILGLSIYAPSFLPVL